MARIVLVADDSPTIQKRAMGILKGEGFEVETVSNGVAAIKRLAVLHPVVILADVSMPGRDGYEVCEFVKKSAELSHVPVLLVASDMEPYDNARGAEVRADGIIKKPFEPYELISMVTKFAQQFEAAMPAPTQPALPVAPAATREPTQEFAFSSEDLDQTPTMVQHAAPDFSAVAEGVAFAEPTVEEAPGYSPEPQAAEMEGAYFTPQPEAEIVPEPAPAPEFAETLPSPEPPSAPVEETPLVMEESPVPSPYAPPPSRPPAERTPSFLEGLEASTPEPVFIEEPPAPTYEEASSSSEVRTMIFRAPLEIAEPVWKDETIPAPPEPEPAGPTAEEPQFEAEAPAAPPDIPAAHPPEPPHRAQSLTATSLDSFSLDDATAGQVHFASHVTEMAPVEAAPEEVAPAAPIEESPVAEMAPPEIAPEEPATEVALAEAAPEAAATEVSNAEVPAEAASTEVAPAEAAPEASAAEASPPEVAPEAAPPAPAAEVAAPSPALDWDLIYSIVHKVVVKMSPPPLPVEAVEEMARRLAEEIATEISAESPPPPA